MIHYSNTPPKDPRGYGLPLIRTPANGKLTLAITTDDLIGCPTHWYGGRTVPCDADYCQPCNEGYPWRWHAYIAGLLPQNRRHVICEFTAQAAEVIANYRKTHTTLRNAILTAQRHRNRHNGRVLVTLTPGDPQHLNLPAAPDIAKALALIWNIQLPDLDTPDHLPGVKRIRPKTHEKGNGTPAVIATINAGSPRPTRPTKPNETTTPKPA